MRKATHPRRAGNKPVKAKAGGTKSPAGNCEATLKAGSKCLLPDAGAGALKESSKAGQPGHGTGGNTGVRLEKSEAPGQAHAQRAGGAASSSAVVSQVKEPAGAVQRVAGKDAVGSKAKSNTPPAAKVGTGTSAHGPTHNGGSSVWIHDPAKPDSKSSGGNTRPAAGPKPAQDAKDKTESKPDSKSGGVKAPNPKAGGAKGGKSTNGAPPPSSPPKTSQGKPAEDLKPDKSGAKKADARAKPLDKQTPQRGGPPPPVKGQEAEGAGGRTKDRHVPAHSLNETQRAVLARVFGKNVVEGGSTKYHSHPFMHELRMMVQQEAVRPRALLLAKAVTQGAIDATTTATEVVQFAFVVVGGNPGVGRDGRKVFAIKPQLDARDANRNATALSNIAAKSRIARVYDTVWMDVKEGWLPIPMCHCRLEGHVDSGPCEQFRSWMICGALGPLPAPLPLLRLEELLSAEGGVVHDNGTLGGCDAPRDWMYLSTDVLYNQGVVDALVRDAGKRGVPSVHAVQTFDHLPQGDTQFPGRILGEDLPPEGVVTKKGDAIRYRVDPQSVYEHGMHIRSGHNYHESDGTRAAISCEEVVSAEGGVAYCVCTITRATESAGRDPDVRLYGESSREGDIVVDPVDFSESKVDLRTERAQQLSKGFEHYNSGALLYLPRGKAALLLLDEMAGTDSTHFSRKIIATVKDFARSIMTAVTNTNFIEASLKVGVKLMQVDRELAYKLKPLITFKERNHSTLTLLYQNAVKDVKEAKNVTYEWKYKTAFASTLFAYCDTRTEAQALNVIADQKLSSYNKALKDLPEGRVHFSRDGGIVCDIKNACVANRHPVDELNAKAKKLGVGEQLEGFDMEPCLEETCSLHAVVVPPPEMPEEFKTPTGYFMQCRHNQLASVTNRQLASQTHLSKVGHIVLQRAYQLVAERIEDKLLECPTLEFKSWLSRRSYTATVKEALERSRTEPMDARRVGFTTFVKLEPTPLDKLEGDRPRSIQGPDQYWKAVLGPIGVWLAEVLQSIFPGLCVTHDKGDALANFTSVCGVPRFENFCDLDGEKFDSSQSKQVRTLFQQLAVKFCEQAMELFDEELTAEEMRNGHISKFTIPVTRIDRDAIAEYWVHFTTADTMPSGHPFTTVCNTLNQLIYTEFYAACIRFQAGLPVFGDRPQPWGEGSAPQEDIAASIKQALEGKHGVLVVLGALTATLEASDERLRGFVKDFVANAASADHSSLVAGDDGVLRGGKIDPEMLHAAARVLGQEIKVGEVLSDVDGITFCSRICFRASDCRVVSVYDAKRACPKLLVSNEIHEKNRKGHVFVKCVNAAVNGGPGLVRKVATTILASPPFAKLSLTDRALGRLAEKVAKDKRPETRAATIESIITAVKDRRWSVLPVDDDVLAKEFEFYGYDVGVGHNIFDRTRWRVQS